MTHLIVAATAGFQLLIVLMGLVCVVLLMWSVDRRRRTRHSAARRGHGRHGYKRF